MPPPGLAAAVAAGLAALAVAALVAVWLAAKLRRGARPARTYVGAPGRALQLGVGAPEARLDAKRLDASLPGEGYSATLWLSLLDVPLRPRGSVAPGAEPAPAASTPLLSRRAEGEEAPALEAAVLEGGALSVRARVAPSPGAPGAGAALVAEARVDRLPLQRWVHLAFVVDASRLSLYLDGQLHTVATLPRGGRRFDGARGDVVAGGAAPGGAPAAATGEARKAAWHAGALAARDVAREYREGPTTAKEALLQRAGAPAGFGLRSPLKRAAA